MITFSVRPINYPALARWWTGIWYAPPQAFYSGWKRMEETHTFAGVPSIGYFYLSTYDAGYNLLTDHQSWGYYSLKDKASYAADVAKRALFEEVVAPPPPPPVPVEPVYTAFRVEFYDG